MMGVAWMCTHGLAEREGCVSVSLASAVDVWCMMPPLPPSCDAEVCAVPLHSHGGHAVVLRWQGQAAVADQPVWGRNLGGPRPQQRLHCGHGQGQVDDAGGSHCAALLLFLCPHLCPVCVALTAVVAMCSHCMSSTWRESEVVRVGVHMHMRLSGSRFVCVGGGGPTAVCVLQG